MKYLFCFISVFLLLVFFADTVRAQSVAQLESKLKSSNSKDEKMNLSFQLAEKLMSSSPAKAGEYAKQAAQLATELGNKRREADATFLSAEGKFRSGDYKEASARYNQSWHSARNYGLRDVALNSVEKLQDVSLKQNNYREALKWSQEAVNYLKANTVGGRSGGDAQRRLENQLAAAESDNRRLREQLAGLTGQTQVLESSYRETEQQLKEVQQKTQQALSQKDATITQIARQKQEADSLVSNKARMLDELTKEQLADSIIRAQQEHEFKERLSKAELDTQKSESARNLFGLVAGFVLALAGLLYLRYRAKREMATELSQKNTEIEEKRRRSEDLLLNILPPAIAQELTVRNKVAARKYDTTTVMFVDFVGFTNISENLSPETLVEELDHCFSNFDKIIAQYRIEKIKTIGDAYICASGLSDQNEHPADLIKAALQIQDFLLGMKAERMGRKLPSFDARIGIHTGPVVAGVVGAKKFAYDIWGDTVNIAARMEEASAPGRVNVSEAVYNLSKYEFEWEHRGKIAAKNKGQMDMYFVKGIKEL
jgi:adenylate cyclase